MTASLQLGLAGMEQSAEFSRCRTWRYTLHREWGPGPRVAFLMFNPSTADESLDDPTIRKCRGFAQRWGYGSMVIVNLFAIRGSDPKVVRAANDPVGPDNDWHIIHATMDCPEIVFAWGCSSHMKGNLAQRPSAVLDLIGRLTVAGVARRPMCLGYSADGSPRHPLMLAYTTERQPFEVKA